MNIETLAEYIAEFHRQVVDSGFRRDIEDYNASLPNNQSNIMMLRQMAEKLRAELQKLYSNELPAFLDKIFPTKQIRPFTEKNRLEELEAILDNKTIPQNEFFSKLHALVQPLFADVQTNEREISKIEAFLNAYVAKDVKQLT